MNEQTSLADITFTENGDVDVAQLNALYQLIGWDRQNRRTAAETTAMLRVSHYYIAAHTAEGTLVGFARVCGDPYVAQVLDVITHPAYRRRGIATQCIRGVLAHLRWTSTGWTPVDNFERARHYDQRCCQDRDIWENHKRLCVTRSFQIIHWCPLCERPAHRLRWSLTWVTAVGNLK